MEKFVVGEKKIALKNTPFQSLIPKEKSHFFENFTKKLLKSVILTWGNRGKV